VLRGQVANRGKARVGALAEQLPDRALGLVVLALSLLDLPDLPAAIDEVLGRPGTVLVRLPGAVVVVDRDRVPHTEVAGRPVHVRDHVLEGELRRVDADDDEARPAVGRVPGLQVRKRAQAVDARVRPEVDEHDLPAQLLDREGLAVDPGRDPLEVRRGAVVLERRAGVGREAALPELRSRRAVSLAGGPRECRGVVRDLLLQRRVDAERDQHGCRGDHDAQRDTELPDVGPEAL
jgi:hypothetical protein